MFSALFAAYAVLSGNTAGGPTGAELFDRRNVFTETMCLSLSSYNIRAGSGRRPPSGGIRRAS
jgi:cytochrome o ubiquinol oxidase subunit 3